MDNEKMIPVSKVLAIARGLRKEIAALKAQIFLDQDQIRVLNKASQDWLDGEPARLTYLEELEKRIADLESQSESSQSQT